MMKLVRTTATGALVFILPLGIIAFFVGKIVNAAQTLVEPISKQLPIKTVAGVSATIMVALLGIILVSFLAGLFAQSRIARDVVHQMEALLLGRIPVYGLLKSLSNDMISPDEAADHPVVLVRLNEAWRIGILIGPAAEGTHSVVFLPSSPAPQSGEVMIVENQRLQDAGIPLAKAFSALSARGMGLGELVRLEKAAPSPAA